MLVDVYTVSSNDENALRKGVENNLCAQLLFICWAQTEVLGPCRVLAKATSDDPLYLSKGGKKSTPPAVGHSRYFSSSSTPGFPLGS